MKTSELTGIATPLRSLKSRKGVSEQKILNTILDFLKLKKVVVAHVRNTGSIIQKKGKTFFAKGRNQKGVADILGVYKGRGIAIEVKSEVGRVSPEQRDWLLNWADNGGSWCVARSVSDVEQFLEAI